MIAVDTNLLVYSHRRDSQWFGAASSIMRQLAESAEPWAIPWPCLHEFLAVATHPRIFAPPSTLAEAVRQVELWMESPSMRLIGELREHWTELTNILTSARIQGAPVHDARIAAICIEHGVRELWTADRDFSRFGGIKAVNPLVRPSRPG